MTFEQIMTQLKNKQYQPIYFLMGEEPYFIDVISDYISDNVLSETEKDFNQIVMYGKDTTVYALLDAVKRFPMMSSLQVVILKEAQQLKEFDKIQFYLEKPLKTTIFVVCYKDKPDKRLKIFKSIDKNKDIVLLETKKLYENQIPAWINGYLIEKGYSIAPAATVLLTEYLGSELNKLANELNKLMISLPVNEKKITQELIEKNVGISKDFNVFELQKSMGERDILKTNRIINHFERNPNNNPMIMIISSLYSYFVKILTYHYLSDKSPSSVASSLKINPFFLKDYSNAAQKYPAKKIIQIISTLREYDLKSKGVGSTNVSNGELLREMVYKILH